MLCGRVVALHSSLSRALYKIMRDMGRAGGEVLTLARGACKLSREEGCDGVDYDVAERCFWSFLLLIVRFCGSKYDRTYRERSFNII